MLVIEQSPSFSLHQQQQRRTSFAGHVMHTPILQSCGRSTLASNAASSTLVPSGTLSTTVLPSRWVMVTLCDNAAAHARVHGRRGTSSLCCVTSTPLRGVVFVVVPNAAMQRVGLVEVLCMVNDLSRLSRDPNVPMLLWQRLVGTMQCACLQNRYVSTQSESSLEAGGLLLQSCQVLHELLLLGLQRSHPHHLTLCIRLERPSQLEHPSPCRR